MDDRIHKVFHSGRQKIRTDVSDFLEELEVATRQAVALDRQHIIDQERAAFEALQDWRLWAQKTLALVLGGQVEDFEVVPYTDQGLRDRLNTIPIQRASAPRQEAFRPKVDPKPVFREAPLEAHPWGNLGAKIYDAATRAFPMAAQPFILGTANTGGGVIVNLRNKNGQLLAMAQAGAIDTAMGNLWSTLEAMPRESTTTRVVVEEPHGNVLPREPGNLNDPPPGYRGAQTADEKLEAALPPELAAKVKKIGALLRAKKIEEMMELAKSFTTEEAVLLQSLNAQKNLTETFTESLRDPKA